MDSLATELRLMIVKEAKANGSLKTLRCTNRSVRLLVDPLLFACIKLDTATEEQLAKGFQMLESLSDEHSHISQHVQRLVVCCQDRMFEPISYPYGSHRRNEEGEAIREEKAQKAQEDLNEHLRVAIPYLRNLSSVQVVTNWYALYPSALWSSLETSGIQLQEVSVQGKLENPFLKYLDSFSGLTALRIKNAFANTDEETDSLAAYFFGHILPKHAESLEKLTVTGSEEGFWSYGVHNAQKFERCINLREAEFSFDLADISDTNARENMLVSIFLDG
ncbi:hypothetical protein VNI00_001718 [Paramarasmius palmivorus]|uniref:Uncharacterized protein n=1 Tax=Paramarasmius palmivorus TaxID=297713 RepID=A0AAW0E4M4_9AGAR